MATSMATTMLPLLALLTTLLLPSTLSILCYRDTTSSTLSSCRQAVATTARPTWSTWSTRRPYRPWHWHWHRPHRPWWHHHHHGHHHWHRAGTNATQAADAAILAKLVSDAEQNCFIAYGQSSSPDQSLGSI